jgi:DNA-binding NarL/FixJ family response regulator
LSALAFSTALITPRKRKTPAIAAFALIAVIAVTAVLEAIFSPLPFSRLCSAIESAIASHGADPVMTAFAVSCLTAVAICAYTAIDLLAGRERIRPGRERAEAKAESSVTVDIAGRWGLTAREKEVVGLIVEGKTNAGISEALFISTKTVETHLSNIFRKMGVSSRVQIVSSILAETRGKP